MPVISRFFGITIRMYYRDHPPPHFHASYGESEALVTINGLTVLEGDLPRRALRLVREWATLHTDALREDWERARRAEPLRPNPPL